MTVGIDNLGAVYQASWQSAQGRFVASTTVDPLASPLNLDRVELSDRVPPPELRAEIERASERASELASLNRELHFAKDEESGRITVQVRDLDGNVIRTIPNSEVLDVLSGDTLIQP